MRFNTMTELSADNRVDFVKTDRVRYNEVDMHGGVNNPIYLVWTQDARLDYLKAKGVDSNEFLPVVMEAHISYQNFLTADDEYRVELRVTREKLNHNFRAEIVNVSTGKVSAVVNQRIVFFKDKRPSRENVLKL